MITKGITQFGIILFAFCVSACFGLAGIGDTNPQPNSDYPEIELLSVIELFPEIIRLSEEWSDDAKLVFISVDVFPAGNIQGSEARFRFESPSIDEEKLEITCSSEKCESIIKFAYIKMLDTGILPLDPQMIKTDSTEAARIGQKYGDIFYNEDNTGLLHMITDVRDPIFWRVYYKNEQGIEVFLDINAASGEVINPP